MYTSYRDITQIGFSLEREYWLNGFRSSGSLSLQPWLQSSVSQLSSPLGRPIWLRSAVTKCKSFSVVYITISRSSPLSVGLRIPRWGLTSPICVLPFLGPFTGGSEIQPFQQPGLPPARKIDPGVEEVDPRVKFRHCYQRKEQQIIKTAARRFSRLGILMA